MGREVKTAAVCAVLIVGAVLGSAASCNTEPEPYRPVILDVEDCDAEDIKKKDWRDCPHLFMSPGPTARPVKTAFQPAPTKTKRR